MVSELSSKTELTDRELAIAIDYVERRQAGNLKGQKIEHISLFTLDNFLKLPIVGNIFSSHHSDKADEKKSNFGLIFAVSALASSVFYVIATIPRFYSLSKELYFSWKIEKLSNKNPSDYREKIIVENLKELIKSDLSSNRFKTQGIKAIAGSSFFLSAATWVASYSYNIAEDMLGYANKLTPRFVVDYAKKNIPEKLKFSEQTIEETMKFLSNDNLVDFTKYATAATFGLLAINGIHNLYKDFFFDTEHSKSLLNRKSEIIKNTANKLLQENEKRKEIEMMNKMNKQYPRSVSTFNRFRITT